tara:strand:- start:325 stop:1836 length:1512 start_codon:yes stop_codon:yes gene_type:complete
MKQNFKILFYICFVFILSFSFLTIFLESYYQGFLTSEKNIINVGGIATQNPKQVTLDVLKNILGESQIDEVTINSLGFRGEEFDKTKPENTFRIFLLGGSQMFGTGATSDKTTIPGYLDQYIENENYPYTTEVINSGLKGVDSQKELLLLENMLLDFQPDLVVVYDGLNDLRAENPPQQLLDNWNSICNLGASNNFDVIISLQPIAGFGNKTLTSDEKLYVQNAKNYENSPLLNSLNKYEMYAKNLNKLENCKDGLDLRTVFDNELNSIYIDEAHVSDKGNSIVAKSFHANLLTIMPKEITKQQPVINFSKSTNSEIFVDLQYIVQSISNNFAKKLTQTPFTISENTNFSENNIDTIIAKTQSLVYDDTEIQIIIELIPTTNDSFENREIKFKTIDKTNNLMINNVTYLITIAKNGEDLFTNYFFAEDELIIQTDYESNEKTKLSGDRRYELDAIIMNPDVPITISGSFFESNNTYEFDIRLRTIHDPDNFIILNGFYAKILT